MYTNNATAMSHYCKTDMQKTHTTSHKHGRGCDRGYKWDPVPVIQTQHHNFNQQIAWHARVYLTQADVSTSRTDMKRSAWYSRAASSGVPFVPGSGLLVYPGETLTTYTRDKECNRMPESKRMYR